MTRLRDIFALLVDRPSQRTWAVVVTDDSPLPKGSGETGE